MAGRGRRDGGGFEQGARGERVAGGGGGGRRARGAGGAGDAMPHRVASAEISHPPEVSPSVARANQELMRQLMPPGTAEAETKTKAKDEVGVAK